MDVELEAAKRLLPLGLVVGFLVLLWLEVRVFPLFKRACAGHRAVTRKLGVTDTEITAEVARLDGKETT